MAFELNPTKSTWSQVANKQAYDEFSSGNLNSKTIITQYDPIYNKLVEQIQYTMYRKMRVVQNWYNMGVNAQENTFPGMLREIYMSQRKGVNFPADNGTRPTDLNTYKIIDDTIDVRYHSAQFRWMYGWTIFDEELRRFSGGKGTTIGELAEMKGINMINARNMFMDNLRKNTLYQLYTNVAIPVEIAVDPSDFDALTSDAAKSWLNQVDNLIFQMFTGSAEFNALGEYMQTPKSELQIIMRRDYYLNIIRKAFPDTYNTYYFEGILPDNMILVDSMGGEQLTDASGGDITPTWDDYGMNLNNWDTTKGVKQADENLVAVIMHRDCMGFEDNLNETLFGQKDIEKLATPVRSHYWTKAYYTDLLPCVKIVKAG